MKEVPSRVIRGVMPVAGDVLSVPVGDKRRCLGVVLAAKEPFIISAFTSYVEAESHTIDLAGVTPSNVLAMFVHGAVGLLGEWKNHGQCPGFQRDDWPPNRFYNSNMNVIVEYDQVELLMKSKETRVSSDPGLPADGIAGHIYVEERLKRLLAL